jgi:hypothetical protein
MEPIRIVDMISSNTWAEFAGIFAQTLSWHAPLPLKGSRGNGSGAGPSDAEIEHRLSAPNRAGGLDTEEARGLLTLFTLEAFDATPSGRTMTRNCNKFY